MTIEEKDEAACFQMVRGEGGRYTILYGITQAWMEAGIGVLLTAC